MTWHPFVAGDTAAGFLLHSGGKPALTLDWPNRDEEEMVGWPPLVFDNKAERQRSVDKCPRDVRLYFIIYSLYIYCCHHLFIPKGKLLLYVLTLNNEKSQTSLKCDQILNFFWLKTIKADDVWIITLASMMNLHVIYSETNRSNFGPSVSMKLQFSVQTLVGTEKTLTANQKWNIVILKNNSESYPEAKKPVVRRCEDEHWNMSSWYISHRLSQ